MLEWNRRQVALRPRKCPRRPLNRRLSGPRFGLNDLPCQAPYCEEGTKFLNINYLVLQCILVCGEEPRSRCYGRTAALRLILQPL
jgi:hypothetical protein